jgi:hypothetical protein
MPRPYSDPENKRDSAIIFRVTDAEKTSIEQLAWADGMTVSDLIKSRVLGKEPKRRQASPDRSALINGITELARIGNNINQIARAINSGKGHLLQPDEISNALYEVKALSKHLLISAENGH